MMPVLFLTKKLFNFLHNLIQKWAGIIKAEAVKTVELKKEMPSEKMRGNNKYLQI